MTVQPAYEIAAHGPLSGTLTAPASKSVTNRVLVLACLADGRSVVRGALRSDDSDAMLAAIEAFGAGVDMADEDTLHVGGTSGRPRTPGAAVDARLSGTTLRFMTAVAALAGGPSEITGAPPLLRRPIGPLLDGLRSLGATASSHGANPPVKLAGGGLGGGEVDFSREHSTQYASALLMVGPYAAADVTVLADRSGAAAGYLDLTVDMMDRWGAQVSDVGAGWRVRAGSGYQARTWDVEYDASAAAHLFALAVATAGTVTVTNVCATRQPDARIIDVLARMGASVRQDGHQVAVTGPVRPRPVDVDLHAMPDQVTTVAALAALAEGESWIRGVAVVRGHETDRIAALATELAKLGADVRQLPDGLVVRGGGVQGPAVLQTYDDHRLAMAFTAIGARVRGVTVADPGCVGKTYPGFWQDAASLGLRWREVHP